MNCDSIPGRIEQVWHDDARAYLVMVQHVNVNINIAEQSRKAEKRKRIFTGDTVCSVQKALSKYWPAMHEFTLTEALFFDIRQ